MSYKYEFKNLKSGKPCCRSNETKLLCASCLRQALAAHQAAGATRAASASTPTVAAARPLADAHRAQLAEALALMAANAAVPSPEVPAVPSLTAAIVARRTGTPLAGLDAPVFGGGPRPRPRPTANAAGGIDDPPSLVDAIRSGRTR